MAESSANGPQLRVGAVIVLGDELLMVRRGSGAADGDWDLPGSAVSQGEALAECVARSAGADLDTEVLCGPFLGWNEDSDHSTPWVRMYFDSVLAEPDLPLGGAEGTPEAAFIPLWQVTEIRVAAGVAELLADVGVIDLLI